MILICSTKYYERLHPLSICTYSHTTGYYSNSYSICMNLFFFLMKLLLLNFIGFYNDWFNNIIIICLKK